MSYSRELWNRIRSEDESESFQTGVYKSCGDIGAKFYVEVARTELSAYKIGRKVYLGPCINEHVKSMNISLTMASINQFTFTATMM